MSTQRTRKRKNPAVSSLTTEDFLESLDGNEERAIKKTFKIPSNVPLLGEKGWLKNAGTDGGRALIFIDERRNGSSDAYAACQRLSLGVVIDYFADPVEDEDDEDQAGDVDEDVVEEGDHPEA